MRYCNVFRENSRPSGIICSIMGVRLLALIAGMGHGRRVSPWREPPSDRAEDRVNRVSGQPPLLPVCELFQSNLHTVHLQRIRNFNKTCGEKEPIMYAAVHKCGGSTSEYGGAAIDKGSGRGFRER